MAQLFARRLLKAGWRVAALDVNQAGLDALGDDANVLKLLVDVRDEQAVVDAVARTEAHFGPITRVVNAAAIMPFAPLMEMESATIKRIFDINFLGMVHVCKATVPLMMSRGQGDVVIFGSLSGIVPIFYMGAYGASKFATLGYTETLQQETRGKGVHVMCVCPPGVKTPLLDTAKGTKWPKFLDVYPAISADTVIDAVERGLRKKQQWVYPGILTRPSVWSRRIAPGFLWWFIRLIERPT